MKSEVNIPIVSLLGIKVGTRMPAILCFSSGVLKVCYLIN